MNNISAPSSLSLSGDPLLLDELLSPLRPILEDYTRHRRDCPEITDSAFLSLGCQRTLSQCVSGRDFLQQQAEVFDSPVARASFFGALHSSRRLNLLREVSVQLYWKSSGAASDLLAAFPELRHRPVLAGDGHHIQHACHAPKDGKDRYVSVNSLYLLCLHSGFLLNLAPVQGHGIYQHEMPVFRKALPGFLQSAGQKIPQHPIFVLDPAFIDNGFWTQHKAICRSGAALITRPRQNMVPKVRHERPFDAADPVNTGIDGDCLVEFSNGRTLRLIEYTDPETRTCYQFLTTDLKLRPGVVAWLYFLRWRIEKVFDTAKNKLQETKGWANGRVAQEIQSHFLAITHNLLIMLRGFLQNTLGLEDEKLKRKRAEALKQRKLKAGVAHCALHPLHDKMPAIVQLSVQFIRTLRNQILKRDSLSASQVQIRAALFSYL